MKEITQVWSKLANIKSSLANSKMSRCDEIFRLKRAYVLCLTINNCRTSKACTECCGPEFLKPVTKSITDWYTYNSSPFQDKLFMCLEWMNQSISINQSIFQDCEEIALHFQLWNTRLIEKMLFGWFSSKPFFAHHYRIQFPCSVTHQGYTGVLRVLK